MGIDRTVFIPLPTAYQLAAAASGKAGETIAIQPGQGSAVRVRLKPEAQGEMPAYRAAFELEQAMPAMSVIQPDDLSLPLRANLKASLAGLRSASFAIWPIAALLAALVFALAANERKHEIGIGRSMGGPRRFVFLLIMQEALILSGVGTTLGLAEAAVLGFSRVIAQDLRVPFAVPGGAELGRLFAIAFVLALATGALAALYPAFRAGRMAPYQAMRKGEWDYCAGIFSPSPTRYPPSETRKAASAASARSSCGSSFSATAWQPASITASLSMTNPALMFSRTG
jgi:putative ABC transport system permease protein